MPSLRRVLRFLACGLLVLIAVNAADVAAQTIRTGPSVFCIVVDGQFTDCNIGVPGPEEWSDIDFLPFNGANVYTAQTLSPPNLFLMYDLIQRTVPLGPAEAFDVRFDVVEDGELEHYLVRCFGNGMAQIFVDGVPQADPEGIECAVGFGPSPAHPGPPNVFVELRVPMNVVYSPDIPLFWSTSAPRSSQCRPGEPGCPPQGEPGGERQTVSRTIVNANPDGSVTVASIPDNASPSDLCDIVGALIDALVPPNGDFRNHGEFVSKVAHRTEQAVASMVNSGAITAEEGEALSDCIISKRARSRVGKK